MRNTGSASASSSARWRSNARVGAGDHEAHRFRHARCRAARYQRIDRVDRQLREPGGDRLRARRRRQAEQHACARAQGRGAAPLAPNTGLLRSAPSTTATTTASHSAASAAGVATVDAPASTASASRTGLMSRTCTSRQVRAGARHGETHVANADDTDCSRACVGLWRRRHAPPRVTQASAQTRARPAGRARDDDAQRQEALPRGGLTTGGRDGRSQSVRAAGTQRSTTLRSRTGVQPVRLWPPERRIGRNSVCSPTGSACVPRRLPGRVGGARRVRRLANRGATIASVLGILSFVLYIVAATVLLIQRSHDMDLSGWWTIAAFIPLVGLLWVFKGGTRGVNRWGAPPPPRRPGGSASSDCSCRSCSSSPSSLPSRCPRTRPTACACWRRATLTTDPQRAVSAARMVPCVQLLPAARARRGCRSSSSRCRRGRAASAPRAGRRRG